MSNSIHRQLLDIDDMQAIVKTGAAIKAGSLGKAAQIIPQVMDAGTKTLVATSLITGIPLGIMAHMIHNKIKSKRDREKEMDQRINYYQQAGRSIEDAMAAQGIKY